MQDDKENNKLDANYIENEKERLMANSKKRIHNKKTHSYYEIRQRTTEYGRKGQIKGKWKKKK